MDIDKLQEAIESMTGDCISFDGYNVNARPLFISEDKDGGDIKYTVDEDNNLWKCNGLRDKKIGRLEIESEDEEEEDLEEATGPRRSHIELILRELKPLLSSAGYQIVEKFAKGARGWNREWLLQAVLHYVKTKEPMSKSRLYSYSNKDLVGLFDTGDLTQKGIKKEKEADFNKTVKKELNLESTNKIMNKEKQLIESIERLTGKKVTLIEAKEEKIEKETKEAAEVVSSVDKTVAGIIPPVAIEEIKLYVESVIEDIDRDYNTLKEIKLTASTKESGTDFYAMADEMYNNIKKLARIAQFCENSIKAEKFDKVLLDKIVTYKG